MTSMREIRWHGRGGQGAWTASELLARAGIEHLGIYAQSFPEFGPERMGAPVRAFTRISNEPIRLHCGIYNPDVVAVLDPTLLYIVPVFEGLEGNGVFVINTTKKPKEICQQYGISDSLKVYTIPATDIAMKILGRPITNTAILGPVAKGLEIYTDIPKFYPDALGYAIKARFPGKLAEKNMEVIRKTYKECLVKT